MPLLAEDTFDAEIGPIWEDAREASVVGERLRLGCIPEYAAVETLHLYTLVDSTYTVELVTRPDPGAENTTQAILEASIGSGNKLIIYIQGDRVFFQKIAAGVESETWVEYEPIAHRWWRVRLEGSTVFWETSPDGSAWTTRRTEAAGFDVEQIAQGRLLCGFYGSETGLSPAYAEFDNFSIFGPVFPPEVVTGALATGSLMRSALMSGTVNPRLSPTAYYFEYGLDTEYGRRAPLPDGTIGPGNDPVTVSEHAVGLEPATTYHYRLVAESEGGVDVGDDETFTTSPGLVVAGVAVDPIARRRVFDAAAIADYNEIHEAPGAITEVPDPLGSGETVLKLTVGNDDVAPITPTENPRAQLLSADLIRPGDVCRLHWKLLVGEDFPAFLPSVEGEGGWFSLVAFYGPPFAGTGPWEISINGGDEARLTWQRNGTYGFDIPWQVPLERGVWISGIVDFLYSRNGWLRMSVNGEPIVFFDPETSYNPYDEPVGEELVMATRDSSNDGEDGQRNNHVKISNYRLHNMFLDPVTVYYGRLILERLAPVSVRL